jgi:hypothetical protein
MSFAQITNATAAGAREDNFGFALRRIDSVRTVTLIEVTTAEGAGTVGDPVRLVSRFYAEDGSFVGVSPAVPEPGARS